MNEVEEHSNNNKTEIKSLIDDLETQISGLNKDLKVLNEKVVSAV